MYDDWDAFYIGRLHMGTYMSSEFVYLHDFLIILQNLAPIILYIMVSYFIHSQKVK